jgi:HSP20 family protein
MTNKQIAPYRPLSPLSSLRTEVDHLLESFARQMDFEPLLGRSAPTFSPKLDVVENAKALTVTVELPGIEEKDVEVELTADRLILTGEKTLEKEEKGDGFHRKERRFGSFRREITLPWEIDAAKVKADATFKNGVLTVRVPKPKGVKRVARKVPVTAA